jgi:hypothetical protein
MKVETIGIFSKVNDKNNLGYNGTAARSSGTKTMSSNLKKIIKSI